jgi:hypothetical protein
MACPIVSHFGRRGVGADEINLTRIDRGDFQGQCNRRGDPLDIRQNQIAAVIVAGKPDDLSEERPPVFGMFVIFSRTARPFPTTNPSRDTSKGAVSRGYVEFRGACQQVVEYRHGGRIVFVGPSKAWHPACRA